MADFNNPSACYSTHQFNIATFQYPFNGNAHGLLAASYAHLTIRSRSWWSDIGTALIPNLLAQGRRGRYLCI